MRRNFLGLCLAALAAATTLAPEVRAGDDRAGLRITEQWRLLPRPPFQRPADPEITARITRQIDPLAAFFQPGGSTVSSQTIGDSLIEAKARVQLFRLESLLRLYVRAFPDLEKFRREVKEVEDGLGAYSYAVDSLNFAEEKFKKDNEARPPDAARRAEQESVLKGLQKKKETAQVVFARLVENSPLGDDLAELRSAVASSFAGWGFSKDRAYVSHELDRVLRDARDGRFNFNLLEDGVHEFRRRLRWFPMLIDSLDGLVLLRDDPPGACPVPALQTLEGSHAARHRYSNPALAFPSSRPCTLSRCLLWPVVKTTNDLGHLKDVAQGNAAIEAALDDNDDEVDVATSNKITAEESARANAIRTELLSSRALDALMGQLSACN